MIGRRGQRKPEEVDERPLGFDDFDLRLGDMMRGERATMGKSLLDVQRELKIRASYIAAIENCDASAFETPGFIAGFVRSYARYLGMDPDKAFAAFCTESGFKPAHGMSAEASTMRKPEPALSAGGERDPFATPAMAFSPARESILAQVDPRALGSLMVLIALITTIGYGGWSVLNEIQRVRLAPVEQTPVVLSDLDPLKNAGTSAARNTMTADATGGFTPPSDGLTRLYRPQALDTPVLAPRDAPIATLDPSAMGAFAAPEPDVIASAGPSAKTAAVPQVVESAAPEIVLMAVRPAWVRVRSADGTVLFEKILDAGEEYVLPATEEPPTLRAGMSGSVYFKLNGALFGPAGSGSSTVRDLALDVEGLKTSYELADLDGDPELARIVALAAANGVVVQQD